MQAKVSVGPATVAGYGATVVGLVATGLAVVFNVDQEQAAVIAGAAWTVVAFSWTQWGRYVQARDATRRSSWGAGGVTSQGLAALSATQTTTEPRPSATVHGSGVLNEMARRADVIRDNALDPDAPDGPDKSLADPALDDPEHGVETREQHSGLKG